MEPGFCVSITHVSKWIWSSMAWSLSSTFSSSLDGVWPAHSNSDDQNPNRNPRSPAARDTDAAPSTAVRLIRLGPGTVNGDLRSCTVSLGVWFQLESGHSESVPRDRIMVKNSSFVNTLSLLLSKNLKASTSSESGCEAGKQVSV